jgi:hypothetical protein
VTLACLLSGGCTPIERVHQRALREADAGVSPSPDPAGGTCVVDDDCPTSSACASVRCEHGACISSAEKPGSELPADQQVPGDCRKIVCDGLGSELAQADDADLAASDGNPCHMTDCSAGLPKISDRPDGSDCNNGGACQRGVCSICSEGSDCSKPSDCTVHRVKCVDGHPQLRRYARGTAQQGM